MEKTAAGGPGAMGAGRRIGPIAAVIGGILQLVVGYFTFTAIGLVSVPVWAIVVLAAVWLAGAVLLWRTVQQTPVMALVVPAANALVLWGVIAAGGAWLGWSG